jgi:hypothetical protein
MLALGQHDAAEVPRVRAHIDGCADCRAALAELQRTASVLPLVDPVALQTRPAPPPDLADRILRQVRDERRARRARRRRRIATVAGAAAALAIAVGTVVVGSRDHADRNEFAIEAPGVDGSFSIEGNGEGTAVTLVHEGLDPKDVYWLWLTDASGDRVSAGTFHGSDDRSSLVLQSAMSADDAVRIWVTDEHDEVVLDSEL